MEMQFDLHDSKVYKDFFDNTYQKLIFFAKNLIGNKEDALDIVVESFIKVWAQKPQFFNMHHLEVYFFRVVKNACIDYLRKNILKRRIEHQLILTTPISENVIVSKYQERELVKLLYYHVSCLPDRMQQVIKLTHLEGYSRMKVAQMLELSPNTIRNTNVAAMKTLKIAFGLVGMSIFILNAFLYYQY